MSKVLGKRRGRSWDAEIDDKLHNGAFYAKFRPLSVLVPHRVYTALSFLRHRRIDGQCVSAVVPCIMGRLPLLRTELGRLTVDFDVHLDDGAVYRDVIQHWDEADVIKDILACLPLCTAFLMGMRPRMGRNESEWIEVDEDTRKRVRSPPDSSVHRAFVQHALGERQLVREIFSFLC